jgi:carbon-monoxide dehydrogenase medium subunit
MHFDETLKASCPIVSYTAGLVGDPQVRHRGTIGGSAAHGDPASDLPCVLTALDAEFVIKNSSGERTVTASDFFKGLFETDLSETDMLTEIRVPKTNGNGWSYKKVHHRAQDWAVVGVAAVTSGDTAALALATMAEIPMRAVGVQEALASGASIEDAAERADENTSPPSDPFGSAEYRRALVKVTARRALEEARSR